MRKIALLTVPLLILGLFSVSADVDLGDGLSATVSGDATLTWGLDLDNNATGFTNASSAGLEITIVPEQTLSQGEGADDELWAEISLKDFKWVADEDGSGVTAPTVEATLHLGAFSITTFTAPTIEIDYVSGDDDVSTTYDGNGGLTLAYALDHVTLSLGVLSEESWTGDDANTDNANAFLGTVALDIGDDADLEAKIAYGHEYDSQPIGIGAKATFDLGDIDPSISFDGKIPEDGSDIPWDVGAGFTWNLSTDENASFAADVKMTSASASDSEVGVSATLTEGDGDEGALAGLGASLKLELADVTGDSSTWEATVSASYDVEGIKPFFTTVLSNESGATTEFTAGLEWDTTDHLTTTIQYDSDDISGGTDPGEVTVAVKVSY